jgi:Icc-related predicted phosphoesterase
MAEQRIRRILCAADPRGSEEAVTRLADAAERHDVHAIAVAGGLSGGDDRGHDFRTVFKALGKGGRAAFWVPGPTDAPVAHYLREAHTIEVVFPFLHGVHGTAAVTPDQHVLFAGYGGEVNDAPDEPRDEVERLRYPRWEAEYRLKLLREFPEMQLVLVFATHPAHKGLGTHGSEALAELIGTYRPRLVVCGGERGSEMLGRTLVVAPGSLAEGHYAVADVLDQEVQQHELAAAA